MLKRGESLSAGGAQKERAEESRGLRKSQQNRRHTAEPAFSTMLEGIDKKRNRLKGREQRFSELELYKLPKRVTRLSQRAKERGEEDRTWVMIGVSRRGREEGKEFYITLTKMVAC